MKTKSWLTSVATVKYVVQGSKITFIITGKSDQSLSLSLLLRQSLLKLSSLLNTEIPPVWGGDLWVLFAQLLVPVAWKMCQFVQR